MNDKELADRIVALGVGCFHDGLYWLSLECPRVGGGPEWLARDWQVAGALMEKVDGIGIDRKKKMVVLAILNEDDKDYMASINDSLPRAICEACVEALTND